MKKYILTSPMIALLAFAAPLASGQIIPPPEAPDVGPGFVLEVAPVETPNRIGLNYRMGLNITVDFKNLGGLTAKPIPFTGSAVNRTYADGYNKVDIANNNHGGLIGTWYWGYTSPNSVQGDNLVLHSYASPANAVSKNNADDPQPGVELTYSRELFRGGGWRAGIEGALGYTWISVSDSRTLKNTAYRTNDSFALNGVVPPPAPYNGTFEGPSVIIDSSPWHRDFTELPNAAAITGTRELDAGVYELRLGPYLEIPIAGGFAATLSGGLTLGVGHTEFSYRENVAISDSTYLGDVPVQAHHSGSSSETAFLAGGYVGGNLSFEVTKQISLVAGAQFQALGQVVNNASGGKQAVLNLNKSIFVSIGATYSF